MIKFANPQMITSLKNLWCEAFGDTQKYASFVFERCAKPKDVFVYVDDNNRVQAMLCIRFAKLYRHKELERDCAYIYGVCTAKEGQGKGISSALLSSADRYLKSIGISASLLVPASETLFNFYSKRGYKVASSIKKVSIKASEITKPEYPCVLVATSLGNLWEKRQQTFCSSQIFLSWNQDYLQVINDVCKADGGEVLKFSCHGYDGYIVCYKSNLKLVVQEISCSNYAVLNSLLVAVHKRFAMQEYEIFLREDIFCDFENKILPYAMIKWYDVVDIEKNSKALPAYIAHVID